MQERFFILGCQRTGTTLMRLIIETHPDVFCYDELKGYGVLQNPELEDRPSTRLIGFKIPRWTEQLTCDVLFDEGPEGPCNNFYNGEKILFLFRDVLDTISSMFKLNVGQASWCESWVPPIIETKLARDPAFRTRYNEELDIIENCDSRLVGLAALYWKYKTEAFFSYSAQGFPVAPVSYEQLVEEPRPVLEFICRHLGIPFHENLLRHNEFQHAELFGNGLTLGNTDPGKPIQPTSIGQWRRFLSDQDLELIAQISGDLPAKVAACLEAAHGRAGHCERNLPAGFSIQRESFLRPTGSAAD